MAIDFRQIALNMIGRSPQIKNNPNAQAYLQVIQDNDSSRGEQIANNICETYGVSKEQAVQMARQFFKL